MHNHQPNGYVCPICVALQGYDDGRTLIQQEDIIYRGKHATALVSSFAYGSCPPHVIVVPNHHAENVFDLDEYLASFIQRAVRKTALAMMEIYGCGGIMQLQNNGPDSGQHAWHYHMHLFPRFTDDDLLTRMGEKRLAEPEERGKYANELRSFLFPSSIQKGKSEVDPATLQLIVFQGDRTPRRILLLSNTGEVLRDLSPGGQYNEFGRTLAAVLWAYSEYESFTVKEISEYARKHFGITNTSKPLKRLQEEFHLIKRIAHGVYRFTEIKLEVK